MKYRIKKTAWDNWYGYAGNKKVAFFSNQSDGSQEANAKWWLEERQRENARPVCVEKCGDSHFVYFMDRKARQRHCAAIFHQSMKTLEEVRQWVRDNPKLKLID